MTEISIKYKELSESDYRLAVRCAPCLVYDKKEPFLPQAIGISLFYDTQRPASLLFYHIRNNLSFKQRLKDYIEAWVMTLYHTLMNDRKTDPKPFALYKFYNNRPQPVLMTIRDKWKKNKAEKVIEYAIYYSSDIVHIYDLEHVWVYLNKDDEIIGVKGTRHGVIMTLYGSASKIKYQKKHPIVYCTPGKHSNIVDPKQLNRRILERACGYNYVGKDGVYDVQFFNDKIWKKVREFDPGKEKIREVYRKHYTFKPTFKMTKYMIPTRKLMKPWYDLMEEIPDRIIKYLKAEVLPYV
ncbi:MAG: hypothetical protein GF364_14005 [Candidatus Lokiarchaeota archaeon]|nr:hypothetical protein [Candidatus Lokiarchaeota archaeon]